MKITSVKLLLIFPLLLFISCRSSELLKRRYQHGYYFSNSGKALQPLPSKAGKHSSDIVLTNNSVFPSCITSPTSSIENKETITRRLNSNIEPRINPGVFSKSSNIVHSIESSNSQKVLPRNRIKIQAIDSKPDRSYQQNPKAAPLDEEGMFILLLILSLLVPPLAIYLKNNRVNKWFWIALVCCFLAGGIFFNAGILGTAWLVAFLIALLFVLDIIS